MSQLELSRNVSPTGIAYHRCGSGPAILLIHGVGLRAESWLPQIDALAVGNTVYAIDLPGLGESRMLDEPEPTIRHFTEAVHRFVSDIIAEPVIACGHSLGALIAIDLAIAAPDDYRAIAPLNGVYQRTPEALAAVQERARQLREQVGEAWDLKLVSAPVLRWFGESPTGQLAEMARMCTTWLEANDHAGYAAAYSAFANTSGPAPEELSAIAIPALFLTGEHDPNSTPDMSRAMAAEVAGSEAVVVPDAAHMTGLTHPDAVNAALLAFVEKVRNG
ncbi:MAG: alpha/beta fold hydrolase [Hyphomicrobiaceae bacterium]